MDAPKTKTLLGAGTGLGALYAFGRLLWDLYGGVKQAQDLYDDRGGILGFLQTPWAGVALAVSCLVGYVYLEFFHDKTVRREPAPSVPRVRPYDYSNKQKGAISLINDSDVTAYQVSLRFAFGSWVIQSVPHGLPTSMIEPHGKAEMAVQAERRDQNALTLDALYAALLDWEKAHGQELTGMAVPFQLQYQDRSNNWYCTDCTAARDVLKGVEITTLGYRSLAAPLPAPVPPPSAPLPNRAASGATFTGGMWEEEHANTIATSLNVVVTLVPNLGAGATPGLHVKVVNKTSRTLVGVSLVVTNLLRWDEELAAWVTSPQIHDSGTTFRSITWGKATLHPNSPADLGFIRATDKRIQLSGHADGGTIDHRFTADGIWQMSYEVVIPDADSIGGSVCFSWIDGLVRVAPCPN